MFRAAATAALGARSEGFTNGEHIVKLSKSEIALNLLQQGMFANERGDFTTAIITLSQSIQLMPQPSAYYHRGWAYRQSKKLHDALADLNMALQLKPNSVDIYMHALAFTQIWRIWSTR